MKPLLQIGYIPRAHGLHGELVIKTFDPQSTAINEVDRVVIVTRDGETKEMKLESVGESPGSDLLIRFKTVTTRVAADALRGSAVSVYRDDLEAPEEGEFFHGDLVGLEAFDPEGKRLGVVEEIWDTGPVPNLCIRDGEVEILVPFADEFVSGVDIAGKRLTVTPLQFDE